MHPPLTREFLLRRGYCCDNECKNCPYKLKENKMIEDEDYTKFDELVIEASDEVWWHTTVELKCKWNEKEFTVRDSENPKGREFIWMEGSEQFTEDEMNDIEEYMYSGEIDLEAS